jgi:DNA topoisomerase-1
MGKAAKAMMDGPASGLLTGERGGTYYITKGNQKVYATELPGQKGAGETAPKAEAAKAGKAKGAVAREGTVGARGGTQGGGAAPAGRTAFAAVPTNPKPKVATEDGRLRPGGGAGDQLPPEMKARLQELGVGKLPAAHIAEVFVSPHLNDPEKAHQGALLRWKDDKGRLQAAYTSKFDEVQAVKKWERVTKNRPKVEKAVKELEEKAQTSPAHAAALLMQQTSLRPGSNHSVKAEGHFGATTIQARHITFEGDKAHIAFIGKQGKLNKATVDNPALVSALRAHVEGKAPHDRVFQTTSEAVRDAAPKGVKLKDFRTIGATAHAESILKEIGKPVLTGNTRQDARAIASILKGVSEKVSARLNNTPAMARRSYIAPQVVAAWAKKNGVEELVTWP